METKTGTIEEIAEKLSTKGMHYFLLVIGGQKFSYWNDKFPTEIKAGDFVSIEFETKGIYKNISKIEALEGQQTVTPAVQEKPQLVFERNQADLIREALDTTKLLLKTVEKQLNEEYLASAFVQVWKTLYEQECLDQRTRQIQEYKRENSNSKNWR